MTDEMSHRPTSIDSATDDVIDRSPSERRQHGQRLRKRVPRSCHAHWQAAADRPDPLSLLRRSNRGRASHLVPVRYGRMAASPFAFLRGSADIMAFDLAATPVTGHHVQLCGDAHIGNFGGFGTAERSLVFDLNDFDETAIGPWEWDLKRLAASVAVLGQQNGLGTGATRNAILAASREYRSLLAQLAEAPHLDVAMEPTTASAVLAEFADDPALLEAVFAKGRERTASTAAMRLAEAAGDQLRFREDPPLLTRKVPRLRREIDAVITTYRDSLTEERRSVLDRYRVIDVARKVVGVSSVGLGCYALLWQGSAPEDVLLLQLKEARPSAIEEHVRQGQSSHHGQRVVIGQRITQAASDPLLGWTRYAGRDFYVRQLRDMKSTVPLEELDAGSLAAFARLCAGTLARAHARSGDSALIAGYLGRGRVFDKALASFAETYADQVQRDYQRLLSAISRGQVRAMAETG